jgi:glycosyltransferase involved in cell wall biosynthesis
MMSVRLVTLIGQAADMTLNFRSPLIADLVKAGYRVEVLAPDWSTEQLQQLHILGAKGRSYPLKRTGLNPFEDLRTFWQLYRYFRQVRPDVTLSYATKTNIWATFAARLAGVPKITVMIAGLGFAFTTDKESPDNLKHRALRGLIKFLLKSALKCAHQVIVQNQDDAKLLIDQMGLPKKKIIRINGTGVPLDQWTFHPPFLQPLTFTLVARLLREKGILEFLEASKQIKSENPMVRFCLLGPLDNNPGKLTRQDIEPWIRDGIVEWPGAVDVKPWLAQTSVFVLPSYYREGIPRSTLEAMAFGRPIITTDTPGCRETVIHGVNGFLVPPRDTPALVSAMKKFIDNPDLIEPMGIKSRNLVEERFDVRRNNAIIIQTLMSF